jgi:formylglycine-generating enzyme
MIPLLPRCAGLILQSALIIFVITACHSSDREGTFVRNQTNSIAASAIDKDAGTVESNPMDHVGELHSSCPPNMKLVDGKFCDRVKAVCLYWVDLDGHKVKAPSDNETGRCGEFRQPIECVGHWTHKTFCMDEMEYPNIKGQVPESWMTWNQAHSIASTLGKRLCTKSEWSMACSGGEKLLPFPYGYKRDSMACNIDRHLLPFDRFKDSKRMRIYDALLVPSGSMDRCVSSYGIADLTGNLDELVVNESGHPYKSSLVGGDAIGVRNNCFAQTTAHNENFGWFETGMRLCSDTK